MKIRDIKYLFKEGLRNVFLNGLMSLASVGTVVASLVILGVFILFSMNISSVAESIKSDCEIVATVDENISDEQLSSIKAEIEKIENIKAANLITKDEAYKDLQKMVGDSSILQGLDENPLRNYFEITVNDLSLSNQTTSKIGEVEGIVKIKNNQDVVDKIIKLTTAIKVISAVILVLLVLMTLFIISNTIKIAMYARRNEIQIMKYIGATDQFIKFPFMVEGIIIGVCGSIISFILVFNSYIYIFNKFMITYRYLADFVTVSQSAAYLGFSFVVSGLFIGFIGSRMSIRKYLKV